MLDLPEGGRLTAGESRAAGAKKRGDGDKVTAAVARGILLRGEGTLHAAFPKHQGDRSKKPVPLSFLLGLDPDLATALAEGYALHCLKNVQSADRRYNVANALKNGFVAYIGRDGAGQVALGDIDEVFLHGFKGWLDNDAREGYTANEQSRAEKLSALQLSLAQLLGSREWKPRLSIRLRLIERPYKNLGRGTEHNEPMLEPDYEKMFGGAANDIAATVPVRKAQWAGMKLLDGKVASMTQAGRSSEACAVWLEATYGNPVPSYYEMGRKDADYPRLVRASVHAEAERILYPSLDEIVPMLLVVCAFFALNPTLAFKLRKGGRDYRIDPLGDLKRLRMYPDKKRASLRQRNVLTVTDDWDNPGQILRYLEDRTERLGEMRPEIKDRAFAFFSWATRRPVTLNTSDREWKRALKRFADRHKITEFTLDQLRPSTLDLVHELSGGNIIAMQGLATHTTAQTTYTFYTTAAQRLRNREKLGENADADGAVGLTGRKDQAGGPGSRHWRARGGDPRLHVPRP